MPIAPPIQGSDLETLPDDTDLVEGAESDGSEDDDGEGKGFLRRLFGG